MLLDNLNRSRLVVQSGNRAARDQVGRCLGRQCLDAGVDVPVAGHQGHCQILSNVGRKAAGGAGDADAGFSVFESGTEIEAKGVRIVNGNL